MADSRSWPETRASRSAHGTNAAKQPATERVKERERGRERSTAIAAESKRAEESERAKEAEREIERERACCERASRGKVEDGESDR